MNQQIKAAHQRIDSMRASETKVIASDHDSLLKKAANKIKSSLGLSESKFVSMQNLSWILVSPDDGLLLESVKAKFKSLGGEVQVYGRRRLNKSGFELGYIVTAYFAGSGKDDPLADLTVSYCPDTSSITLDLGQM